MDRCWYTVFREAGGSDIMSCCVCCSLSEKVRKSGKSAIEWNAQVKGDILEKASSTGQSHAYFSTNAMDHRLVPVGLTYPISFIDTRSILARTAKGRLPKRAFCCKEL